VVRATLNQSGGCGLGAWSHVLPRRSLVLVAAAVAALAVAGCSIGDDGPRTAQARDVAGFTRIALDGTAGRLAVDLDGSGDADLGGLAARAAHVDVRGSGDVDVRAGDRLDVQVDGAGDVRYHAATRR
jgi:hypothetical protein